VEGRAFQGAKGEVPVTFPRPRRIGGAGRTSSGPGREHGREPSRRRARRALGVLGAAVLIAVATVIFLVGMSWVRSEGAIQVVEAQVQAIRAGNVEEAYGLFSRGYQRGTSLPSFRRWLRRQGGLANVQNLQFWGRSVWGRTAVLWGRFEDDLGHRYPVRYLLVREGGVWRIERFQLSSQIPDPPARSERLIGI